MRPGRLVLRLVLLVVLAWFGYQGYLHVTSTLAVNDRLDSVADRWQADTAAQKQASGGRGGVTIASLEFGADEYAGWLPVTSYAVNGATLTITATYPTCAHPPVTVDVRASRDVVVVLVHDRLSWAPSRDRIFPPTTCAKKSVAVEAAATLTEPLGDRVVVDATTAESAQRS